LVEALPVVEEIVANRLTFGVFVALGVLVATSSRSEPGAPGARRDGVRRAAALVCLPVFMFPARTEHLRAVSTVADDALRAECGGDVVMTVPQTSEQDGMAWQARTDFDFRLLRGFAFRESSEPKGALTILDGAARGSQVDVAAAVGELAALGVGCVLADAGATVTIDGVSNVLGPPIRAGDVAIWSRSQGVLQGPRS
jgi:hypothetical protein